MDDHAANAPQPLPPHTYPFWIKLFSAAMVLTVAYALALSPKYFTAARDLRGAEAAFKSKQYEAAAQQYREVLRIVPSSRAARISLAEAMLSDPDQANDSEALRILVGVGLTKGDCIAICKRIPAKFHRLFQNAENR